MWVRPSGLRTVVLMPYVPTNKAANIMWLKGLGLRPTKGVSGTWEINRAKTDMVREEMLVRWPAITVIVDTATQNICGPSCQQGLPERALQCVCVCAGANHGWASSEWVMRGDFAISTEHHRTVWRIERR